MFCCQLLTIRQADLYLNGAADGVREPREAKKLRFNFTFAILILKLYLCPLADTSIDGIVRKVEARLFEIEPLPLPDRQRPAQHANSCMSASYGESENIVHVETES